MGHFSDQYIDDCDSRTSDDDYLDRRDGVSSKPAMFSQPVSPSAYTKTITPAFETKKNGKRGKLTGYIGELRDGEMLVHSMEYSTNSQAEAALDALAFELLTDLAEQGLVDELPAFEPTTCVYCHKPHHPQACPEMRALLFAPDTDWEFAAAEDAEMDYDDNNDLTEAMADDDYADAMAEQAMGTYNGNVPADFATNTPRLCDAGCGAIATYHAAFADDPYHGYYCAACGAIAGYILDKFVQPLDVEFAPTGFEV